jgi:hypothetical protein
MYDPHAEKKAYHQLSVQDFAAMLAMQLNIALRKGATSIFSAASAAVNCVNSVLCVKIQFKIVGGSHAQTVAQVVWLEHEYTGPGRRTLNTNRFSDPTDDRNYGLNPRCISWKTWSCTVPQVDWLGMSG